MLKKNQIILGLLVIAVFVGIAAVAIMTRASGGGGTGQILGDVTYPNPNWQPGDDYAVLYDSTDHNRLDSQPIDGGGGKYWYNMLIPPHSGHYYVHGEGEHCCSVGYYVYWQVGQNLEQDIIMDQPNNPNK
ncbi:MAG TPA: hypothetical protein VMT04_03115 [Terriglobales bacterium]|nr:hypothetical protein [Terriglobales bacterium]